MQISELRLGIAGEMVGEGLADAGVSDPHNEAGEHFHELGARRRFSGVRQRLERGVYSAVPGQQQFLAGPLAPVCLAG